MKNRKYLCAVIAAMLTVMSAGCGESSKTVDINETNQNTVQNVLEQGMAEADNDTGSDIETVVESVNMDTDESSAPAEDNVVTSVTEEIPEAEDTTDDTKAITTEEVPDSSAVSDTGAVDVDLTALSSTMVYSEVYNMMTDPGNYIGKTVKMSGVYAVYHDESTGKYYHACIISDATACCSQGIEFELKSGYSYPDDYPEEGGEICVTGIFDTYEEGEYTYCTLRNASI